MSDITLCKNEECPLKENCGRYQPNPDKLYQNFAKFDYKIDEKNNCTCDFYFPYKPPMIFYV